jgi:hypothetical protein
MESGVSVTVSFQRFNTLQLDWSRNYDFQEKTIPLAQFTTDSTLTNTVSKPMADHQKLYRPAVIIVMKRRNPLAPLSVRIYV